MDTQAKIDPDWREYDPELSIKSPTLQRMLDMWNERRGTRAMPSRKDFDAAVLLKYNGQILLIDVEHNPRRYRFRLVGIGVVELLKRDLTGHYFEEVYTPAQLETLTKSSEYCIKTKLPIRIRSRLDYADRSHVHVEILEMPLSSDGETVDMIMKCVVEAKEG